jgi:hypothetical protein
VRRRLDSSLGHTVYRKPTHTDLYLYAKSEHHSSKKQTALKMLIQWERTICNGESLDEEIDHLKRTSGQNGYSNLDVKHALVLKQRPQIQ